MRTSIALAEAGLAPDFLTRRGIRHLLRCRLRLEQKNCNRVERMVCRMSDGPLAVATDLANEQHYEVPARFFQLMLGESLKYSCAYYENGARTLNDAEQHMLDLTIKRARLQQGQEILELGCGWGSLSIAMATAFPDSIITAVSNSGEQKSFIDLRAERLGLKNLTVITSDMNDFQSSHHYDRVVSIEMFEHMRNYKMLFERIGSWLKEDGMLFFHIFCHKETPYFFADDAESDWMARHFFTGGVMPSFELPMQFRSGLALEKRWSLNGLNYASTCADWLANLDSRKSEAISILTQGNHPDSAHTQFQRWRLFVMACQELFSFNNGEEWFVAHYLLRRE